MTILYNIIHESESEVAQSCPILCNPMYCSSPGSSIHGILQARVLEWVAISFSQEIFKKNKLVTIKKKKSRLTDTEGKLVVTKGEQEGRKGLSK